MTKKKFISPVKRIGVVLGVTPIIYLLVIRPWHLRWGATEAEVRQPMNEQAKLHDLKPVLHWIGLVILIYLHCAHRTVLEAKSSDIQPGNPDKSLPNRQAFPDLRQPGPVFLLPRQNGRYQPIFYPAIHPEWAWFWTTMGEDQWP